MLSARSLVSRSVKPPETCTLPARIGSRITADMTVLPSMRRSILRPRLFVASSANSFVEVGDILKTIYRLLGPFVQDRRNVANFDHQRFRHGRHLLGAAD